MSEGVGDIGVSGYDLSHYQSLSVHAHMKQMGAKFCIIKASEGRIIDSMFAKHYAEAKRQGMIIGTYDFFHPSQDPVAQASLMEKVIGKPGPGNLGPAIDWETTDGLSASSDKASAFKFLQTIAYLTGRDPIVYGSASFLRALTLDVRFADFALWVAHYGVAQPRVPAPWPRWSFWQWTDGGSSNLDLDKFNGTVEQLNKFAKLG